MVKDRQFFVNLPVVDLEKSTTFFMTPGFNFIVACSDENAGYMIVGGILS